MLVHYSNGVPRIKTYEIEDLLPIMKQLLYAVCSSISVEKVLSTFGRVHSNLRNKLGV